jgi:hypothetical protein
LSIRKLNATPRGTKVIKLSDNIGDTLEELKALQGRVATIEALEPPEPPPTAPEMVVIEGGKGEDGSDGAQGPKGDKGEQGSSLVWRGDWKIGVQYEVNDVVRRSPSTYIAVAPSKGEDPRLRKTKWELFVDGAESSAAFVGNLVENRHILVTDTEYYVNARSLSDGYNVFEINSGGNTTMYLPEGLSESKIIVIKNRMDSYTVTTQAV